VVGRYFLMITLGVIFGTTVMSRFTLLIGRLEFMRLIFQDWGAIAGQFFARLFG